jgi:hypothetical protein
MSYDLMFKWRRIKDRLPPRTFAEYFRSRPLYEVSESQAWYSNETTGVYFCFDISEEEGKTFEIPDQPDLAPIAFNINYFRPHFFGLEAEPELTAFVRAFDFLVSDPQNQGMGDGEYSPEGFLRGWNAGNEFGYRVIISEQDPSEIRSLPTHYLESIWRWNYTRDTQQKELGDQVYVPRIFFFDYRGSLCTGIAWGDAIPILLPHVDLLLVPRIDLAPRKIFKKVEDFVLFEWAELEDFVNSYPYVDSTLPANVLDYDRPPDDLVQLVVSRNPPPVKPEGVAPDQVLNQEIINKIVDVDT